MDKQKSQGMQKFREVQELAQGHSANEWQRWNVELGWPPPKLSRVCSICMNPMQAALPSRTPSSACHSITDRGIFFFVLFWFQGHSIVTFCEPDYYSDVL